MRKMLVILAALALLSLSVAPVMAETVVPGGTTPYAWYRADVGVNIVGDGDNTVTGWADQSGNARDLGGVHGTPQLTNNGVEGRAAITFDFVTQDYLLGSPTVWGTAPSGTVFAVWKRVPLPAERQWMSLYDGADLTSLQRQLLWTQWNATALEPQLLAAGIKDNIFAGESVLPDPVGEHNWVVTSASHTTGISDTVCINGVEVINGNMLSGGMDGIIIGAYSGKSGKVRGYFGGDLSELIVFGGELSASERSMITTVLMNRWSIGNIFLRPGDANGDGFVNAADAAIMAEGWLTQGTANWFMGDFNEDGNVDDIDATIMAANWGAVPAGGKAAVPEPGSLILLAGGLIALLLIETRRRR